MLHLCRSFSLLMLLLMLILIVSAHLSMYTRCMIPTCQMVKVCHTYLALSINIGPSVVSRRPSPSSRSAFSSFPPPSLCGLPTPFFHPAPFRSYPAVPVSRLYSPADRARSDCSITTGPLLVCPSPSWLYPFSFSFSSFPARACLSAIAVPLSRLSYATLVPPPSPSVRRSSLLPFGCG